MVSDEIIAFKNPKSIAAESYRALRTNLEFSMASNNSKSILITSSHVSEGKSTIAANLATVFAMNNKKTILIDADMRRGIQHKKFDLNNHHGISSYLANLDGVDFNKIIKKTEINNLSIITCGAVPPNPAELLSTEKMKELINKLKEMFDIIIIDGAPVLPVTDSVILSNFIDKVVIVASSGETHNDELKSVKNKLESAGANIAGVVLNKVDIKGKSYGKGYYGAYTYYRDSDEKENK